MERICLLIWAGRWRVVPGQSQPVPLEHQSTVGGLAFNPGRSPLAVAHYGG